MAANDVYDGRVQSKVKHTFLQSYLERFAHIIGFRWQSITYIDGFSGPWNSRAADLSDSSFFIALRELRSARSNLRDKGKLQRIRCVFVEKDPASFQSLQGFVKSQPNDVEILSIHKSFEDAIPEVLEFIRRDRQTFSFTFIDPTGWTGFAMKLITPIIKLQPGEVLINFMTGHITRHIENPISKNQFQDLYGSNDVLERVRGLKGTDRVDACVNEYCQSIRRTGNFEHVCPAFVLNPERDRPHFNLVYATRDDKGLEVFKTAEQNAMRVMEQEREKIDDKKRFGTQRKLFRSEEPSSYYVELRQRYLEMARTSVRRELEAKSRMAYRDVWRIALSQPLVWERDLKGWLEEWRKEGVLTIEGLGQKRVPNREFPHFLVWNKS
jgi:three-Cys-motif partner protein